MEYRFGLIKQTYPKILCGALVEAPNEDEDMLLDTISEILRHANFVAVSLDGLAEKLESGNDAEQENRGFPNQDRHPESSLSATPVSY